jgi:hypothetical protein
MSLFSELLGKEPNIQPLENVAAAISTASINCRNVIKGMIKGSGQERQEREILIFCELIYFYIHICMRMASVSISQKQLYVLKSYIRPMMSLLPIQVYYVNWPDDKKAKIASEFSDRINKADLEYTEVGNKSSDVKHGEEMFRLLYTRLTFKILQLMGTADSEYDKAANSVLEIIDSELMKMQLRNLIADVKKTISLRTLGWMVESGLLVRID